jgi:hypothetical protein
MATGCLSEESGIAGCHVMHSPFSTGTWQIAVLLAFRGDRQKELQQYQEGAVPSF